MTSTQITIVGNDEGVQRMLEVVDAALNPIALAEFMGYTVGPWLRERARRRFANEGDDAVGQWAPLKDSTIDIRESLRYGGAHPINRREGDLENFIVNSGGLGKPEAWGASLEFPGASPIGETQDKVETAQAGKQYPPTVPRPVLGLSETDLVFVLTALGEHIEKTGKVMI